MVVAAANYYFDLRLFGVHARLFFSFSMLFTVVFLTVMIRLWRNK
jgi:hypothetical protein